MAKFTAYTVYSKFLAMKQHFDSKSNYDYLKYNGKIRAKEETFRKRKDSKMFYRLATKYESKEFPYVFICAFSLYENPWVGDLITSQFEEEYRVWENRLEYLEGHFQHQFDRVLKLSKEKGEYNELLRPKTQALPNIFTYLEDGWISMETFIILDQFTKIFETVNWYNQDTIQYTHIPELEYRCKQYNKFIDIDFNKYGQIVKDTLKEHKEGV